MRLVTLFLIAAFAVSTVGAASYQKTDGTIVDPILDTFGNTHSYRTGNDLESYAIPRDSANLYGADLSYAHLDNANLFRAGLWYANLSNANLTGANLSGANLEHADLADAKLLGTDLSGADVQEAQLSNTTFSTSTVLFDGQTVLQHGFDTAGLKAYLTDDLGV